MSLPNEENRVNVRIAVIAVASFAFACSGNGGSSSASTASDGSSGSSATTSTGSTGTTTSTTTTGGGSTSASGSTGGSSTGSDVTLSWVNTYVPLDGGLVEGDAGWVQVPMDLTAFTAHALVLLVDGGYLAINGTTSADGTGIVHNVPDDVPCFIGAGLTGVITNAHHLDLGTAVMGRPDAEQLPSDGGGPVVTIDLQGLQPIDLPSQYVELVAPNDDFFNFYMQYWLGSADGGDPTGGTELAGQVPWSELNEASNPVGVDPARGDTLFAMQLATVDAGDNGQTTLMPLVGFADLTGVSIGAAGANTVSGTLASVAGATPYSVTLPRQPAGAADLGNGATFSYADVNVSALPGPSIFGDYAYTADILYANSTVAGSTPWTVNTTFANPYPPSWSVVSALTLYYSQPMQVNPGPGGTYTAQPEFTYWDTVDHLPATWTPALSPVRNIRINGQASNAPFTGVGLNPVISWDPPTVGQPDYYEVVVNQLEYDASSQQVLSYFYSGTYLPPSATQFTILPGVLSNATVTPSSRFFVTIIAAKQPGFSLEAPLQGAFPWESVQSDSNLFAP